MTLRREVRSSLTFEVADPTAFVLALAVAEGVPTVVETLRVALDGAFGRLSPEQRAVVALHLYAGYTVAETAEIVGAPHETVRSRLRLAREHLREALGES